MRRGSVLYSDNHAEKLILASKTLLTVFKDGKAFHRLVAYLIAGNFVHSRSIMAEPFYVETALAAV